MKRLASSALVVLAATTRHPLCAVWIPRSWATTTARKENP